MLYTSSLYVLGSNSMITSNKTSNASQTTSSNVPSSQSLQHQIGQNNSNNPIPHSQSAYEIGQAMTHQQALHHQLQQRFANVNSNSGKIKFLRVQSEVSKYSRLRFYWIKQPKCPKGCWDFQKIAFSGRILKTSNHIFLENCVL